MIKICNICKKEYNAGSPKKAERRKTCSYKCMSAYYKGRPAWNKGKPATWAIGNQNTKGKIPWNKGKTGMYSDEMLKKISRKGSTHSIETKEKMSIAHKGKTFTEEHKNNIRKAKIGDKSNFWRGGTSTERAKIYNSKEYKLWRKTVFERDNYTCQMCNIRGKYLEADHIKPFAYYPELRFELSNGRTLCKPCHQKTDTYGVKARKHDPNI